MAVGCVEGLWIGDISDPQCECPTYVQSAEFGVTSYSLSPCAPSSDDTTMRRTGRVRNYFNTRPQRLSPRPVGSSCLSITLPQDLCAYDLESCVPTSTGPNTHYPPQKLNGECEVSFFKVGMIDGKTHVIFSKKKRVRQLQTPPQPQLLTCIV